MISEEIKEIIENNFQIKVNQEYSKLIQSGFNNVYLITDSTKKYIFRMSDTKKSIITTEEDYLFELELLLFLKHKNFPVSYPIEWKKDSYLLKIEMNQSKYFCSLFSFAEGKPLDENDLEKHFSFGVFIGKLHLAMSSFTSEHNRYTWDDEKSLDYPVKLFKEYLADEHPKEYKELFSLKEWLKSQLGNYKTKAQVGLIHGDVHNFNVHFDRNQNFTMFDFDFLGTNYLVFDLSCFIGTEVYFFDIHTGKKVPNSLSYAQKKFFEGYKMVRNISENEIKILPLTEIQRFIILFGSWAHFCYIRGLEKLDEGDKTYKELLGERIQKLLPHLLRLKSKWEQNDLFYYNDLLKN